MQIRVCRRATAARRGTSRSFPPGPSLPGGTCARGAGPGYVTGGGSSPLPRAAGPAPRGRLHPSREPLPLGVGQGFKAGKEFQASNIKT